MQKFSFMVRTAAIAAVFALIAGSSLQAQEEGGRGGRGGQRGQRGGGQRGQRGGGQRGFGQRGFGGTRTARTISKAALLSMEEVQKELKLEGDDLETVTGVIDGYNDKRRGFSQRARSSFDRQAFQEMSEEERREAISKITEEREKAAAETAKKTKTLNKETDEILAALLDENQWKRLGEIQVQSTLQNGLVAAMMDKDFAAKINLSKEQSKKLEDIKKAGEKATEETRGKMREMFSGGFDRSKMEEYRAMQTEVSKMAEERTKKAMETVEGMMTDEQKKLLEEMKGKAFKFPERRGRAGAGRGGQRGGGGGRGGRPNRPSRPGGDDGGGAI